MTYQDAPKPLPKHYDIGRLERTVSIAAIMLAFGLLLWLIQGLWGNEAFFHWWAPFAILAGMLGADLLSGIVHWGADTWGRETMPLIGRRLLLPFRVHHLNPDDFLNRRFSDTNGDLSLMLLPVLALLLWVPLEAIRSGPPGLFAASFCLVGMLTNQVHQWAHRAHPPIVVASLQRWGILLSYQEHARHHQQPYATNYCIATGWCNAPLAAIDFFPRCERLVTRLTGAVPRLDDRMYCHRWAQGAETERQGIENDA